LDVRDARGHGQSGFVITLLHATEEAIGVLHVAPQLLLLDRERRNPLQRARGGLDSL